MLLLVQLLPRALFLHACMRAGKADPRARACFVVVDKVVYYLLNFKYSYVRCSLKEVSMRLQDGHAYGWMAKREKWPGGRCRMQKQAMDICNHGSHRLAASTGSYCSVSYGSHAASPLTATTAPAFLFARTTESRPFGLAGFTRRRDMVSLSSLRYWDSYIYAR